MMHIEVNLTREPIHPFPPVEPILDGTAGAWVEFSGVVRSREGENTITALDYEAYETMAVRTMREILQTLGERHACLAARVVHRVGRIPVGEAAIRLGVAATHRGEAFALATEFMDRLKADVPIWKRTAAQPQSQPSDVAHPTRQPLSLEDTLATICRHSLSLDHERVALKTALGRILHEVVCADQDHPALDRSAMDGYAIGLNDDSQVFRVVDRIRAGEFKPRVLQRGEAVAIATGAALPGENLRVRIKEQARTLGECVAFEDDDQDRNVRFRGEDFKVGDVLVQAGTELKPGTVALLASAGCDRPWVNRLPRVLHLITGDELVPCSHIPGPGQIRDSNSVLVRAFLARQNIEPVQVRVAEHREALAAALPTLPWPQTAADLVIISGGASVGDHDYSATWLESLGFSLHVRKTRVRPGRPLLFGSRDHALAFALPGNPLAHFVCLNLYVRQALKCLAGDKLNLTFDTGFLTGLSLPSGPSAHETIAPAQFEIVGGRAMITPLRWQSSGDLTALATANALVRLTPRPGAFTQEQAVQFLPI